ncbi:MAG: hypothetical protein COZ56_00135, partial [Armatimonadetes bacterium CG_4_8_14_3_um_filter_58_9]
PNQTVKERHRGKWNREAAKAAKKNPSRALRLRGSKHLFSEERLRMRRQCTMITSRFVTTFLAISIIVLTALRSLAQQTNNYALRAVPAPTGGVRLDGNLDEWDLSGEILSCYDLAALRDTNAVRTAAMYDRQWLYLSFRFKDATPMLNQVDPVNEKGGGWRSDCIQLRCWSDHEKPVGPAGGRVTHIDCYWFTEGKRPASFVTFHDMSRRQAGFEGNIEQAIGNGVDAAFRRDKDGKGYTQEIRVSWKLLRRDGRPYVAGEVLRLGIEFFWGDPTASRWPAHRFADLINKDRPQREFFWMARDAWGEVQFLDHGKLEPSESIELLSAADRLQKLLYSTRGPAAIRYDLPHDGYVTLVIEKQDGTRVRNLISDYPRKAGKNTDYWDGADDFGRLMAPGEYRVRGLSHGEFDVRYQFTYGTPANPPWESSDGQGAWWTDHVPPMAVAADGERVYESTSFSEGGSTLLGLDYTGQKQWGMGRISGGMIARCGDYLYMLAGGDHHGWDPYPGQLRLLRIDPKVGKFAPWPDGKSEHVIATFPADRKLPAREPEGISVANGFYDAGWLHHEALGLTAAGGRLYVSMLHENKLVAIDPVKGEKVAEFAVERPAGLAGDAQGNLYAISGTRILRADADGNSTPVVTAGLKAPVGLTADARGNLYVSDWADQMCVKVFSPDGKFLRAIGKVGGRSLSGRYDPTGMFRPLGLAVDDQGRLWVAEHDFLPKRLSVWSAEGKFLTEFCGATYYAGTSTNVNPLNPQQAFSMGNILDLDWKKGLWRVAATLWRPTHPEALLGPKGEGLFYEVVRHKDRDLLIASASYGFLCISELHADHARPLTALGLVFAAFLPEGGREGRLPDVVVRNLWDDPKELEWAKANFASLFDGTTTAHPHRVFNQMEQDARWKRRKPLRNQFLWTDHNGDGLVQDDEIRFFTQEEAGNVGLGCNWRFPIGQDFTLYPVAWWSPRPKGFVGPTGEDENTFVWRLPVREWNKVGAPVYDLRDARLIVKQRPPAYYANTAWVDGKGSVLLLNEDPMKLYSSDGQLLWSYRNQWPGVHGSHRAPKDKRGQLIGPLKVIGSVAPGKEVGEVFCMSGNMGKAFLMTADGLYIGGLFKDCRAAPDSMPDKPTRGVSIKETSPGGEWFGGEFFRNSADSKVYIGSSQAREGVCLSEVTGLESIRRLPAAKLIFTQKQYAEAERLLAEKSAAQEGEKKVTVKPLPTSVKDVPSVPQFDWSAGAVASWQFDENHSAEATWTNDDKNLYLCFRNVLDDTPMVNGGRVVEQLFKTGDAALLDLRTRQDDNTPGVVEGDLRLLLSVFDGKPVAVLYRYKVPGAVKPTVFAIGVTRTVVDEVKVLDGAHIIVDREPDRYTLRASIPLDALGFHPIPGKTYRGDFGVVYSDKAGQTNVLRMHWSNKATGIISDLPSEAQIQPALWGRFEAK